MLTRATSTRKTRSSTKGTNDGGAKKGSRSASSRARQQENKKTQQISDEDARPAKRARLIKETTQDAVAFPGRSARQTTSSSTARKSIRSRGDAAEGRSSRMKEAPPSCRISHPPTRQSAGVGSSSGALKRELEKQQQSLKRKREEVEAKAASLKQSQSAIDKRIKALAKQEETLARTQTRLQERDAAVAKREQEAADLLTSFATSRAEQTLVQLEEGFTCALCFEIIACPYSLSMSQCGHSFCAICILKWFFSHLHDRCGTWHETVLECPLCRNQLPMPEGAPRKVISCPFTPNRLADKLLTDLLDVLCASGPPAGVSASAKRKQKAAEAGDPSVAWREGGSARTEWKQRERKGRDEMRYITTNWVNLSPGSFKAVKERIGS